MDTSIARLRWFDGETYKEMTLMTLPHELHVPVHPVPNTLARMMSTTAVDVEFRLERIISSEDTDGQAVGIYRSHLTLSEIQRAIHEPSVDLD